MASWPIEKRRVWTYLATFIGLALASFGLTGYDWQGASAIHTLMETAATLLALYVGSLALIRYFSQQETQFLYIGAGFIGTALLDGYHALVTSVFFEALMPSESSTLVPWSWLASRFYFALSMVMSWFLWWRHRHDERYQASPRWVFWVTGISTALTFLFFAFVPLPRFTHPGSLFPRPFEFVPGGLLLIALLGYLKKGRWRSDRFEHWLVLALIVAFMLQVSFMSLSSHLYDLEFDVAHLLKKLSYILVLIGLMSSLRETYQQIQQESEHRKQTEATLRASEYRLRTILDNVDAHIFLKDQQGRYQFVNRMVRDLWQVEMAEIVGRGDEAFFDAQAVKVIQANDQRVLGLGETLHAEENLALQGGEIRIYRTTKLPLFDDDGHIYALCGISIDITENKRVEERLRLAASVFSHAREGMIITDPEGCIIDVNQAFSQITGYGRDEILGRNPRFLQSGLQAPDFYQAMWRRLLDSAYWQGEIINRHKCGDLYHELLTIIAVNDLGGKTLHYVAMFSDITQQKAHQQQLERIAHYDPLTGLANRVLLADRLHQAMSQARRRQQKIALAYIDLDGFKAVNDHYGHHMGDQLLVTIAGRIRQTVRETDTVARLGGDEFVAVLVDLEHEYASIPLIERLITVVSETFVLREAMVVVSASIGVSFYPQDEEVDPDQLMRQADQAMYQAKTSGKNRYHLFDPEVDKTQRSHFEQLETLRQAFSQRQFVLYYQPKVNLRTGRVIGLEALIRWQHPARGIVPPGEFLPALENSDLQLSVDDWVIETAIAQLLMWQQQGLELKVSVNVSPRQLQQPEFLPRLKQRLDDLPQLSKDCLELEILETSALEDYNRISQVIAACADMGVSFALDDFGTGYSSLSYLKNLPAAVLKIDRSFVGDMLDNPDDLAILQGVLGLAKAFHRQPIAEGVESLAHCKRLLMLGCEWAQGYYIARPMPADAVPEWLAHWQLDPALVDIRLLGEHQLMLLFALTEYRAWMKKVKACLKGGAMMSSSVDADMRGFGDWLAKQVDWAAPEKAEDYQVLSSLHQQVQAVVIKRLAAFGGGCGGIADESDIHMFDALCDQLCSKLEALLFIDERSQWNEVIYQCPAPDSAAAASTLLTQGISNSASAKINPSE